MENTPSNQKHLMSIAHYLWLLSLAIGTALGIGIGAALGSVGAGAGIGIGIGVAVGFVLYRRFTRISSDD